MDYEKPEALDPHVFSHATHHGPRPGGEVTLHGFNEPAAPEDRREFRGDSLWYGVPLIQSGAQRPISTTCR